MPKAQCLLHPSHSGAELCAAGFSTPEAEKLMDELSTSSGAESGKSSA